MRASPSSALRQILELNNNQIRRVQPGFFAALPRLRHLDLCANLITLEGLGVGAAELGAAAHLHVELLKPELPRSESYASRIRVGVAEMMGRRLRMEDSVVVERGFRGRSDEALFAVFDAHAGSDVAEEASCQLGAELEHQLTSLLGDAPLPDKPGAA